MANLDVIAQIGDAASELKFEAWYDSSLFYASIVGSLGLLLASCHYYVACELDT